jgi:hypothetical protein
VKIGVGVSTVRGFSSITLSCLFVTCWEENEIDHVSGVSAANRCPGVSRITLGSVKLFYEVRRIILELYGVQLFFNYLIYFLPSQSV